MRYILSKKPALSLTSAPQGSFIVAGVSLAASPAFIEFAPTRSARALPIFVPGAQSATESRSCSVRPATDAPTAPPNLVLVDVGTGSKIVERGLRVGDQPFHRHVFEFPLAFAIATEIDAQA